MFIKYDFAKKIQTFDAYIRHVTYVYKRSDRTCLFSMYLFWIKTFKNYITTLWRVSFKREGGNSQN